MNPTKSNPVRVKINPELLKARRKTVSAIRYGGMIGSAVGKSRNRKNIYVVWDGYRSMTPVPRKSLVLHGPIPYQENPR